MRDAQTNHAYPRSDDFAVSRRAKVGWWVSLPVLEGAKRKVGLEVQRLTLRCRQVHRLERQWNTVQFYYQ
jgi:hypothetical protein